MGCAILHPYQSGQFAESADATLRPGGLALTRRAVHCAGFAAGQRILDLGCGSGAGSKILRRHGCHSIGLDAASTALATGRDRARRDLVAGSAHRLPFAAASFDGILAECSLSLVEPRHEALAEFHRVLRPTGRLAITDLFARHPGPADDTPPACLRGLLRRDEIIAGLSQAGFQVERWEDHSAVLKVFIARLIFASESTPTLWATDAGPLNAALAGRRPGYFLLIAAKAAGRN